MDAQTNNPVAVLRQGLTHQRPVDDTVLTSVAVLADRLEMLKRSSHLFDDVAFSSDVEAMMAEQLMAAVN